MSICFANYADTQVAPNWIAARLALKNDAVCGTVAVRDWGSYGDAMRQHYDATYTNADGHRHIQGANFGVSARAYEQAGGFRPLESSEDVALVDDLQSIGASIAWSAAPGVFTSARREFRAPKCWCSGAQTLSHGLLTAWYTDGSGAQLVRVTMQQPGVSVLYEAWHAAGMAASTSVDVNFVQAQAHLVGQARGAFRLAALGKVDLALHSTAAVLQGAAHWIDNNPLADARYSIACPSVG